MRKVLLFSLFLGLIFTLAGCGVIEKLQKTDLPADEQKKTVSQLQQPQQEKSGQPVLNINQAGKSEQPVLRLTKPAVKTPAPSVFTNPIGLTGQKFDLIDTMGAGWARQAIAWGGVEPVDNQFDWAKTDKIYNDLKARDLQAVFVLLNRESGWAHAKPEQIQTSMPPLDLSGEWSEEYGYSRTYFDFVYQFVKRYMDRFQIIVIENEANAPNFWGGTADEYIRQLKTAYLAAHQAKPDIIVADSGMASGAWGFTIAKDLLDGGQEAEALKFYNDYYDQVIGLPFPKLAHASELTEFASGPQTAPMIEKILYILENEKGSIDAINFHYYERPKLLPDLLDWLHERVGDPNLPLITNELGTRSADPGYRNSEEFAYNVIKQLTMALASGVKPIMWYWWDGENGSAGLLNKDGSLRSGGRAFQYLAKKIEGGLTFKQWTTRNGVERFRFVDQNGDYTFEVLWSSDGETKQISLDLPAGVKKATVENYAGGSESVKARDGVVSVEAGEEPIFVSY